MDELRKRAEELIEKYKKDGNDRELQKIYIIHKLLEKDKLFFSISIEDAMSILKNLNIENYNEKYLELISFKNFKQI